MSRIREKDTVVFAPLARSFEQLEHTNFRRTMIATLAELFRSSGSPDEIQYLWPRKPYQDQETMLRVQAVLRSSLMRS
jgi:hypothetical protein